MKPLESLAFAKVCPLPYRVIRYGSELEFQQLYDRLLHLPSKFLMLLADDATDDVVHQVARIIKNNIPEEVYDFSEFQVHFHQWKSDHLRVFEEFNEGTHKDILVRHIIDRNLLFIEML